MKLTVVLGLTVMTVVGVTGCSKKVECDICGETKKCKTEKVLGQEVSICSDCQEGLEDLGSMLK